MLVQQHQRYIMEYGRVDPIMTIRNRKISLVAFSVIFALIGIGSLLYLSSSNAQLDQLQGQYNNITIPETETYDMPLTHEESSFYRTAFDEQLNAFISGEYHESVESKEEYDTQIKFFSQVFQNISNPERVSNSTPDGMRTQFDRFQPETTHSSASNTNEPAVIQLDVTIDYTLDDDLPTASRTNLPSFVSATLDRETGEVIGGFVYE